LSAFFSWPIARETARERALSPLTLIATAVLALLAAVRPPIEDPAAAFKGLSGPWLFLLTLFLGADLLSEEVRSGHAQLVLLRPLTRAAYASARFIGASLVLGAATSVAWLVAAVAALSRGAELELLSRLVELATALLPMLAWLATLLALSAVTRGWVNAGILVAARAGWFFSKALLPLMFRDIDLMPWLKAIDPFVGPRDGPRLGPLDLGWDVLWLAAAWLLAVALFQRRELARR
jgi:hypothetical protein